MDKNERRREVSEFAKKVEALAKAAPDDYARKDLNRALFLIRRRYCVPPETKKLEIMTLIAHGVTTVAELLMDTGFTKHQIERGVRQLIEEKKIREEKVRRTTGAGRPLRSFFPI